MAKKSAPTAEELQLLRTSMENTELDFANAKLAYYNHTEYKGEHIDYEKLSDYADAFINANHAYQRARFGRVQIKLSAPRLMRE